MFTGGRQLAKCNQDPENANPNAAAMNCYASTFETDAEGYMERVHLKKQTKGM